MVRLLLIEDNEGHAHLIRGLLSQAGTGLEEFHLDWTPSLQGGLNLLVGSATDVVLLDLFLPDSHGLETFTRFRAGSDVPVVILSSLDDTGQALEALREGAEDFLVKGQFEANLLVRSILYAQERHRRQQAEKALLARRREFEVTRLIQARLLPREPPKLPGFDIAGGCWPAEITGGDLYDFIPCPGGRLGVVIADVSHHGLGPSLIMAGTRRIIRALAETSDGLETLLNRANRAVFEDTTGEQFVSLFFAEIDPHAMTLNYAAAGHESYLLRRAGEVESLKSTGLLLGLLPDASIAAGPPTRLGAGDILLLLTDGMTEARRTDGAHFGIDRILEAVRSNRDRSAADIVAIAVQSVWDFCHPRSPEDDMSIVVVKVEDADGEDGLSSRQAPAGHQVTPPGDS